MNAMAVASTARRYMACTRFLPSLFLLASFAPALSSTAGGVSIEAGRGIWVTQPERFQVVFSHALFGAMLLPAFAAVHYVKLGGSGCSAYVPGTDFSGHIVIVDRGGCTFHRKALNVQAARGVMMIVANHEDTLFGMTMDPHEPMLPPSTYCEHPPFLQLRRPAAAHHDNRHPHQ